MRNNLTPKKVQVVLFNLGGPHNLDSIQNFLFNLFKDKLILRIPFFIRYPLAWLISKIRSKSVQKEYALLGGRSPLLEETQAQLQSLKNSENLKFDCDFFISMRYWKPLSEEVVQKIKENFVKNIAKEIILIPLYPQFSTTTTLSSFRDFKKTLKRYGLSDVRVKALCCYPIEVNFIKAHVRLIENTLKAAKIFDVREYIFLFSAHSLPESVIASGDPYQCQIQQTVSEVVKNLSFVNLEYKITYQSKIGPIKWLSPSTEKEVLKAAMDKKNIILIPVAFVSEHIEVLVELDIRYKKIADMRGVNYIRIETLRTEKHFIFSLCKMLKALMRSDYSKIFSSNSLENIEDINSNIRKIPDFRFCPKKFGACPYGKNI